MSHLHFRAFGWKENHRRTDGFIVARPVPSPSICSIQNHCVKKMQSTIFRWRKLSWLAHFASGEPNIVGKEEARKGGEGERAK